MGHIVRWVAKIVFGEQGARLIVLIDCIEYRNQSIIQYIHHVCFSLCFLSQITSSQHMCFAKVKVLYHTLVVE